MKSYKAIIYDIDGTLLDTLKMNMIPLQRIIEEECKLQLTYEEVLNYASYPGMQVLEEFQIPNPEQVYQCWVRYVNEYPDGAVAYEGIEALLSQLHQVYKQGVVSAKTRKQYNIDFIQFDLYIDATILADDTIHHKPHPEPIEKCIELLGMAKDDVLYVGDSASDSLACQRAGIDFAYASWGSVSKEGIEATMEFSQPSDLLKALKK